MTVDMVVHSRSSTLLNPTDDSESEIPRGWTLCPHPQGWIYFFNPITKYVTDDDIRQPDILEKISEICTHACYDLDEGMEVYMILVSSNETSIFDMVVNHKHCVASLSLHEVKHSNVEKLNQRTLNRCRRRYWNYLFHHPTHVPTPEGALLEASDVLTWYFTDNLISGPKSVVPFSKAECEELSRVVNSLALPCNEGSISKTVFLAWILRENSRSRDGEYYGQHTIKQYQAIRAERNAPQVLIQRPSPHILPVLNLVIKLFFFSIPFSYLAHIHSSTKYRGRLATIRENWDAYINRVVREYSLFLLISTVLLSATVGFLAIPNAGKVSWVAGIVSALGSLGSIIIGVFSVWKHQINTEPSASFSYMHNAQHNPLGLHGHAMLLSLPSVLLVWAVLAFAVSIIAFVIQGVTTGNTAAAWTVVGVFVLILTAVIMGLYTLANFWRFRPVGSFFSCFRPRSGIEAVA